MQSIQQVLDESVAQNDVPFAVGMVARHDGTVFSGAAGEAASGRKAAEDTIFRIFSMTKAVGSTAAMILIDRGQLDADTPVEDILPDFAGLGVLDGWDGDKPRFRAPKTKATIRHLATHTSGVEYEFWNADVVAYQERTGHPTVLAGTYAALKGYPLMTDPGTRWGYGPSIDWLGLVVEKIAGKSIDAFCQHEIFDALGMSSTYFEVPEAEQHRLSAVRIRGADGAFAPIEIAPAPHPEVYGMGHCLYSTAPDYLRFLRMFLNRGELDGRRVLSKMGVDWMLADQMRGLRLRKMVTSSPVTDSFEPFPGTRVTHSFGFMRNEADIPGMRTAGSLSWAGVLNSHYWFDPAKDVAAVIMTQSLPFVEPRFLKTYAGFEGAVYRAIG
jgi:methyl acetate hydrolase